MISFTSTISILYGFEQVLLYQGEGLSPSCVPMCLPCTLSMHQRNMQLHVEPQLTAACDLTCVCKRGPSPPWGHHC